MTGVCRLTDITLAELTNNQVDAVLDASGSFVIKQAGLGIKYVRRYRLSGYGIDWQRCLY